MTREYFSKKDILIFLEIINEKLKKNGLKGEIALFGGSVMCVVYKARMLTKDIDAVFEPKNIIYATAEEISKEYGLKKGWLNDSVKGFLSEKNDIQVYKKFSNLIIYTPVPEYMFALKCCSARLGESSDIEDIKYLLGYLKIREHNQAVKIIEKYIPAKRILPRTKYLLLELLEGDQ